jgi:ribosome-binding factor A
MKKSSRAPSQRQLRVGELVRHALAEILQKGEIHDRKMAGMVISIPEVRMTPDLKVATVFVMPLGGQRIEAAVKALADNRKQIRHLIGQRIDLRHTPDFRFRADLTFAESDRVDALLRSPGVRRDLVGPTGVDTSPGSDNPDPDNQD